MLILSVKDYFRTSLVENGLKGGERGRRIGERHIGMRNYRKGVLLFFAIKIAGGNWLCVPPCELPSPELPSTSEELEWICTEAGASIGCNFEFLLRISTISSSLEGNPTAKSFLCCPCSVY